MDNLFTIRQTAFILKVHQLTIRRYIREKKLPAVKLGGAVRIKETDLQKFQKEYTSSFSRQKPITEKTIKQFSFDDPFWKLNGVGISL